VNAVIRLARRAPLAVSARDRRIIARAQRLLGGGTAFGEAVRALRQATEELIPDGKVFFLGGTPDSAIVGSLVSGVGIVERASGIELVRRDRAGLVTPLGWFVR
jgi:hypothetical protein